MFRKQLSISIPDPCSVPWESMTLVENTNRYCASCEKVIIDFTQMSDAELLTYFNKNTKHCGRFAEHQLNRQIIPVTVHWAKWKRTLLLPSFLIGIEAAAQTGGTKADSVQIPQAQFPSALMSQPVSVHSDTLILEGVVIDSTNSPVSGCIVWMVRDTGNFSASTDSEGRFRLKVTGILPGDSANLHIHYLGYQPYETSIIVSASPMEILFSAKAWGPHFMGVIIEPHPLRSRIRGFFWRLFHWQWI